MHFLNIYCIIIMRMIYLQQYYSSHHYNYVCYTEL